ncbi:MAG: putative metal-binding motif-containing protein [Myxococcales bacterium]|nr:putative metal-binding motif-containing protein [Myxococcales bacterium]MCB9642568.1 putative metal-binding motif-containing protein [Myxococcales bacterium]
MPKSQNKRHLQWIPLLTSYLALGWILSWGGGFGCSECRFDADCGGTSLCQQGVCVGQKDEEPTTDAGPKPSGLCQNGETQPCYTGAQQTRKVGACKDGKQLCSGGFWGACLGDTKPATEQCDGIDNDCNGQIDDGNFGGGPCLVAGQSGPCERGIEKCVQGSLQCSQTVQPQASEICGNGIDDNCNGQVDETPPCNCAPGSTQACYTGDPSTRGKGTCKDGTQICDRTQTWGACVGDKGPSQEVCDNQDNDCDGKTDETLEQPCGVNKGTCVEGKRRCVAGQWSTTCEGAIEPTAETCDNKDNNCDGTVDENLTRSCTTSCGSGIQTCENGTWKACSAATGSAETCDNKDNDCDGKTDEALTRACNSTCGAGTETCDRGQWTNCTAPTAGAEVCDSQDNDCDGKIDETIGDEINLTNDTSLAYYGLGVAWDGQAYGVLFRQDKTIYFQRFDRTGKSLAPAKSITTLNFSPSNLHLIWTGSNYGAFWYVYDAGYKYTFARISTTGSTLSTKAITIGSSSSARFAWNGTYYGAVWYEYTSGTGYQIKFQRYTSLGTNTGSIVNVNQASTSFTSSIGIAVSGTDFGISWSDSRISGNSEVYFRKITTSGTMPDSEVNVSNNASSSSSPVISANGSYFMMVYLDGRSGSTQLHATRVTRSTSSRGVNYQLTTQATSPLYIGLSPMTTSTTSDYGLLWGDSRSGKRQFWFVRLGYLGNTKGTKTQITNTTGYVYDPKIEAISNTLFGAFWTDTRTGNRQVFFRGLCGL